MSKTDVNFGSASNISPLAVKTRLDALRARSEQISKDLLGESAVRSASVPAQRAYMVAYLQLSAMFWVFYPIDTHLDHFGFKTISEESLAAAPSQIEYLENLAVSYLIKVGKYYNVPYHVYTPALFEHIDLLLDTIEALLDRLDEMAVQILAGAVASGSAKVTDPACKRYVPGEKLAADDPVIIAFSASRTLPSAKS